MFADLNTAVAHSSRKRPRTCEEEGCEFMPISKRINDLHIRSSNLSESGTALSENAVSHLHPRALYTEMCNHSAAETMPITVNPGNCPIEAHIVHNHQSNAKPYGQCSYTPELDAVQNPYYYHINEVLFEAHVQRLQRLSKCLGECSSNI